MITVNSELLRNTLRSHYSYSKYSLHSSSIDIIEEFFGNAESQTTARPTELESAFS